MKKEFYHAFFTLLLALAVLPVVAQVKTTKVSGKVLDGKNGAPLVGATVVARGESNFAAATKTDVEGQFFFELPQGKKFTINISNIGFADKMQTVSTGSNDIAPQQFQMEKAGKELGAVVVTGSARREAVATLYNAQKNASAISDGISAEMIRKSPDRNTGEVLKRVSGASIQDNKFVIIRGLSERYNVSLLNNSVLPSTEADKKAFAFDILPSSIVDNIVINKSASPDLPGDFAGGAIKIFTKDYPNRPISELNVSIGYNTLTTGKNFYKGYPNGGLDQLGFLDNSRLIPGPYYRHRSGFISQSDAFKTATTKMFSNSFGSNPAVKSLPNISVSYTGGNTRIYNNGNKLGYVYNLGYSTGRAVGERNRSEYDIVQRNLYDYHTNNYDEKNNLTALLNLTYSYRKSKISLKNLFNNSFVKTLGLRSGNNYENGEDQLFLIKSSNTEVTQNGLLNSVVEGLHQLNSSLSLDWNASYGYTYKNQPDQKILSYRSPENSHTDYYLKLSNENSPEIRNAGRVYSFLGESIYGASVNATKRFNLFGQAQKLKLGTMNYYRDRNVEVDALGYASLQFTGVTIQETKETSFGTLFSADNIDRYKLTIANIETNSANYHGTAMLNAGYLLLDNQFSEQLKLTWGARIEKYNQQLSAKGRADKTYDNTDILPSLLLTYSLNNKTNLRLGGSQTVNRPEFRELADYSVFDYDNYVVVRGNPDLVRAKTNNADLRYEWFPSAGEIISASMFYKYFTNPIEQVNKGNDVLSYENADHATSYGAEVELRKKLDFINDGSFFSNLIFYANAAYIKGAVKFGEQSFNSPLQGQSPYLVNGGLNYTSSLFSVNLLYNRIGPRLKFRAIGGGALNIFEKPRDVVDLQIGKSFLDKKLELKLTISDLLAQPYSWYYKYEVDPSNTNYKADTDKIINKVRFGTTATLSIKYNFGR